MRAHPALVVEAFSLAACDPTSPDPDAATLDGGAVDDASVDARVEGDAGRAPTSFRVTCDGAERTGLVRDPATGLVEVPCNGDGEHLIRVEGLAGI